jgi:hypothetical protein
MIKRIRNLLPLTGILGAGYALHTFNRQKQDHDGPYTLVIYSNKMDPVITKQIPNTSVFKDHSRTVFSILLMGTLGAVGFLGYSFIKKKSY